LARFGAVLAVQIFFVTAPARAEAPSFALSVETYTLRNGLQVVFHVDRRQPVVSVHLRYHVGAANEAPGEQGLANLVERLAFDGHRPGGERMPHLLIYAGASAFTARAGFDATDFFSTVPRDNLEAAIWIEAERLAHGLDSISARALDQERRALERERRRFEAAPLAQAREQVWRALFPEPSPYHTGVFGRSEDLAAVSVDTARGFFRRHYVPANATLVLAGDFVPSEARGLVDKHFGRFRPAERPVAPKVPPAASKGQRRLERQTRGGRPALLMAWQTPGLHAPEQAAAEVLARVLAGSRAALLPRRLGGSQAQVAVVEAGQQNFRARSVFHLTLAADPGADLAALERAVDEVLEDVRGARLTTEEVDRARLRVRTEWIRALDDPLGRAVVIQGLLAQRGRADAFGEELARLAAVTPKALADFARRFLGSDRRVVLRVLPSAAAGEGGS
jgi:zinc protease